MKKLSYSSLLILCAVLSQGIAVVLDQDIEESSYFHIRQKRVIKLGKERNKAASGPIPIASAPYIVNIRRDNISECAGTILSAVFVLALYSCVTDPLYLQTYTILSGSAKRNSGILHVVRRRIRVAPNPELALLEVSPHIDIQNSHNRPISLFLGEIPHIAYGVFSGWGCTQPGPLFHKPIFSRKLMQARLFIIPLEECIQIYEGRETITIENICTLDSTKRRGICVGDLGGPLVRIVPPLMLPQLIGVALFRGEEFGKDPDVFINLNHQGINEWITHIILNHVVN